MVRASLIRKLESIEDPKLRDVLISFLEEAERIIGETVTRSEFLEFVQKTDENFRRVWEAIRELTEAQKKTEEELAKLTRRVDNLAQRVDELAEAQKRTEQRLDELAEAQKKTEERLEKLIEEHQKTREQLGGLSNAFGYVLEDRAIRGLAPILREKFKIEVTEPLRRDYIEIDEERAIEVNLIGRGRADGRELTIIGECKAQLRKRDVDKFLNYVRMLDRYIPGEKFLVLVTYQAPIEVKKYVREKAISLVFSYELPL